MTVLFVLSFAGAFSFADAATVISQTNSAASVTYSVNPVGSYITQTFGTGLSGVADEVSVMVAANTPASIDGLRVQLYECNSDTPIFTSCTQVAQTASTTISSTPTQYFLSFEAAANLDPTKYYMMLMYAAGGGVSIDFYGKTTTGYANGLCQTVTAGTPTACTGVADLFFILNGTATVFDTSYTSNLSPVQGSTTATTLVDFEFDYHAAASHNIIDYVIQIRDLTAGQSFSIDGSASSGDHSVSRTLSLSTGHLYNWVAYICSSAGTCYGGPNPTFSVVTSNFQNAGAILYASSTFPIPPIGQWNQFLATTTADIEAQGGLNQFLDLPGRLSEKFPFSWLYEIGNAWNDAIATTSGELPTVAFDFQSLNIATGTKAALPNEIEMFSTSTISRFLPDNIREIFKLLVAVTLWVGLATNVFFSIKTMFA